MSGTTLMTICEWMVLFSSVPGRLHCVVCILYHSISFCYSVYAFFLFMCVNVCVCICTLLFYTFVFDYGEGQPICGDSIFLNLFLSKYNTDSFPLPTCNSSMGILRFLVDRISPGVFSHEAIPVLEDVLTHSLSGSATLNSRGTTTRERAASNSGNGFPLCSGNVESKSDEEEDNSESGE